MEMDANQYRAREDSQLFPVRVWAEESTSGAGADGEAGERTRDRIEWCGKLQHVVTGEAQYFRGWPTLIDLLLDMTKAEVPDGADRAPPDWREEQAL